MKIRKSESVTGKTSARKREFMKLGITKFVIVAAVAVLVMVGGSTAAWAQCPISPSYTPDFTSYQTCLALNPSPGTTPVFTGTIPNTALQLTTSSGNQTGSAWYATPQVVENGFTTSFSFKFTSPSSPPADGIAFVIQSSGSTAIGYTGGNGGALGYGDDDSSTNPSSGAGIPKSLAIEFDTFENAWDPVPDPTNNSVSHVAIQSCGAGANTSHHNTLCGGTSGLNSTLGAPAYTANLADGNPHSVTITYYAATASTPANLHVAVDGNDLYPNGVDVDLASIGVTNGTNAFVGFTAATGGDFETQDILSWTFAPAAVPLTLTELGVGTGSVTDTSNNSSPAPTPINCSETGGVQTGNCLESDEAGASVTLTANATSPSTFGGWGGACASFGTMPTCSLTMDSAQNVTADFVAPPNPQTLNNQYCPSGSSNTASTTYCPNGSNAGGGACTDPNGVIFTVQIPVVNLPAGQCLSLQATATEVSGTGICPGTQALDNGHGFPTGPTTDFDCRFVSFYNYGTDSSGNVTTPLCYPYSNGNCVYYNLQLLSSSENGTPIGPVPQSETPEGVIWQININPSNAPITNPFTVPAGYNSVPRMLDDPDEFNSNLSTLPYGTSFVGPSFTGCDNPMNTGSSPTPTAPPIYCQFDNDITTFFSGVVGGDIPLAGGRSSSTNDVVLAFLPTASGTGATATPPTPVYPAITLICDTGCSVSNPTITFTEGTPGTAEVTETDSPYPTPALVGWKTTTGSGVSVTAAEVGNTVTLTAASSFGVGFVAPNVVIVSGCTVTGYDGTFAIATGSGGTTLSYFDNTAGLAAETDTACTAQAATPLALPAGLTFTQNTGALTGTPADGTAGTYPVNFTASNGVGSATLSYMLTVGQAPLSITASSATVPYGTGIPTITPIFSAFVNGDMASVLGTVTCSATAVPAGNPVGTYATNCSGAMDSTYSISYVPGTLKITAVPLTITASSAVMTYGGTPPIITPTFPLNGLVNGDTAATLGVSCRTTATSASLPGNYPSSCTASNGGNYAITYVNGTVTVAGIDVSPLTVNFGTLYLDQLGLQFVTLKNTTTVPITITSITLGGGTASGDFGDLTFCPPMILKLPATLPAGKSCAIGVGILTLARVFSPTASTTYLTIADTAATQQVLLTALVINPQVSLSSTNLSFGTQTLNKPSTPKVVTLTNSGTTPLQLTSLTSSNSNFTFTTTCPTTPNTTLAPTTGTCTISVTFTPTSTKNVSGTLTIRDNAANSPQVITLSGN
jgi:Legume lectin domain/MBG domain (YGX type)/Abnormal spindle-like microcephaly-assoc'd, ASPM-SPD-2-Hydin/Divergent InlB B-repeat domain